MSDTLFDTLDVRPEIKQEIWDETLLIKNASRATINLGRESSKSHSPDVKYGYADEIDILKPYTFSMKAVANMVGVKHRTLLKGLRELNIIVYTPNKQNIPDATYIYEEYFIVIESKRGYTNIQTTKATNKGMILSKTWSNNIQRYFPQKNQ